MAESGWLTRSLEQPYPYTLEYNGKISNKKVKEAFLGIIDFIQNNIEEVESILRILLHGSIEIKSLQEIKIMPLENAEILTIDNVILALTEHFTFDYKTHGGAKLPVLAFYSIYSCLIKEVARYRNKTLRDLGSHTASDRTSNSAGDIEVFNEENSVFEAIEIKLDKIIDANMVRIAREKIYKFNPNRYYILSNAGLSQQDNVVISELIHEVKEKHGCQIIINGLIPTLKYYLRLIECLDKFITNYGSLIERDKELQKIHKEKWNELINLYLMK
jgi:cytosine-specific methyltransferase